MSRKPKTAENTPQNDTVETTQPTPSTPTSDYDSPVWNALSPEDRQKTQYLRLVPVTANGTIPKPLKFIGNDGAITERLTEWENYDLDALGALVGAGPTYVECRGDQRGTIRRLKLELPGPDRINLQAQIEASQLAKVTSPVGVQPLPIASFGAVPIVEGLTERERVMYVLFQQQFFSQAQSNNLMIATLTNQFEQRVTDVKQMLGTVLEIARTHQATEQDTKTAMFSTVNAVIESSNKTLRKNGSKQMGKMFKLISEDQRENNKEARKKVDKLTEKLEEASKKKTKHERTTEIVLMLKEMVKDAPQLLDAYTKYKNTGDEQLAKQIADDIYKREQAQQTQQLSLPQPTTPLVQPEVQPAIDANAPAMVQPSPVTTPNDPPEQSTQNTQQNTA